MSLGSANLVRSTLGKQGVGGVWTGGGAAANCSKSSSDWSSGITSVNYNAATGKYRITLSQFGQQLVGGDIKVCRAAGDAPLLANIVRSTLTVSSPDAATLDFEVWDVDATAALTDLATTDKLLVNLEFASAAPG